MQLLRFSKFFKKYFLVVSFLFISLSFLSVKAYATDFWEIGMSGTMNNINNVVKTIDNKFLVIGEQNVSAKLRTVIGKINQDGSVDTSFGTNGFVTLVNPDSTSHYMGKDLVQNSDGSIVIAGNIATGISSTWTDILVLKLQANGNIDTTFGTNGFFSYKSTSSGAESVANSIVKTSDGGYLIGGYVHSDATDPDHYNSKFYDEAIIIKLTSSGQLDTSFGYSASGRTVLKISVSDQRFNKLIVDSSGKIYACGVSSSNAFINRFNANGTVDTSYNSGKGNVYFYYGSNNGYSVNCTQQADGKIVAVDSQWVTSPDGHYIGYSVRFNTNGTLDTTYGISGVARIVTSITSSRSFMFEDVVVDSNNNVVIMGRTDIDSYPNTNFAITRLTPSGQLDSTFDGNGIVQYSGAHATAGDYGRILTLSEGGYLAYGNTGHIFKINSNGLISGCSSKFSDTTRTLEGGINVSSATAPTIYSFGSTASRYVNIVSSSEGMGGICSYNDGLSYTPTPTNTPTPTLTPTPYPTALPPAPPEDSGVVIEDPDFTDVLHTNLQGIVTLGVADIVSGAPIALVDIDTSLVSGELIWTDLSGASSGNRSVLHYPGGISNLPGQTGGEFILFVPKGDGDSVLICPGATTLGQVILGCMNGYFLDEYASNVTIANINGVDYWRVTGLSGTGGMSVIRGVKDTLTRLKVGEAADHRIIFGANYGIYAGEGFVIEFDPTNKLFDLSSLTVADLLLTDPDSNNRTVSSSAGAGTWGAVIDSVNDKITFSASTDNVGSYPDAKLIVVQIGGTNKIINPINAGSYQIIVNLNNRVGEQGIVAIPIVDNDRVDITGYVTEYMHFDIDTAVGEVPGTDPIIDCEYNTCLIYAGGNPGSNYTVDLGELTSAVVNKSNSTSVKHSTGDNAIINSIYFDLSTNASSGAVVTVRSANGGLQGPGTNYIPSIGSSIGADGITRYEGEDIPANSGVYGVNMPVASSYLHGNIIKNTLCDSETEFCGPTTTPKVLFDTNNLPVDTARIRLDLAASANYTNNPGVYTDTLTFIATPTF